MKSTNNIGLGEKVIKFQNVEDMNSAYIIECVDVYEISPNDTAYELQIKQIKHEQPSKSYRRFRN